MSDTPTLIAPPSVLVTRPAADAQHWVAQLQAQGVQAQALPLITIAALADPQPLHHIAQRLDEFAAVMFVSANAVAYFFAQLPAAQQQAWSQGRCAARAWSPGPGTTRALVQAGLAAPQIDEPAADAPQFDSEALWAGVAQQVRPGQRVLIVRGSDEQGQGSGRDWLAQQLTAVGVQVENLSAYRRIAPRLDEVARVRARQAAVDGTLWLFSSSEAIHNLVAQLPTQDWRAARAIATHPRIATTAREAGWGVVCESRPALASVVASIKSCA